MRRRRKRDGSFSHEYKGKQENKQEETEGDTKT